jgi:hypothetical protein
MPIDMFFDDYEESATIQLAVDDICASCIVRKDCLEWALEEGLIGGVFGRKFLGVRMTPVEQNIEDVKVLWPYLTFSERCEWADRLKFYFDNNLTKTIVELSSGGKHDDLW